jgi:RNA polymerase sigma-70 factor (ECF subfamily)
MATALAEGVGMVVPGDPPETEDLLRRAGDGDRGAVDALLALHRERLRLMARLRLDDRVRPRVDASDVVQEVCLEAAERLPAYLRDPSMPFLAWLRFLTRQRLAMAHRHHIGVKARDARREVPLDRGAWPQVTSAVLADGLAAREASPSSHASRAESKERLLKTLDSMDPMDREVLCLRHFEELSNAEIALELGIPESTASKRYIRAFRRLRGLMAGGGEPA